MALISSRGAAAEDGYARYSKTGATEAVFRTTVGMCLLESSKYCWVIRETVPHRDLIRCVDKIKFNACMTNRGFYSDAQGQFALGGVWVQSHNSDVLSGWGEYLVAKVSSKH
jgi:hypothetical protein